MYVLLGLSDVKEPCLGQHGMRHVFKDAFGLRRAGKQGNWHDQGPSFSAGTALIAASCFAVAGIASLSSLRRLRSLTLWVNTDGSSKPNPPAHKLQSQQIQPSLQFDLLFILAAVGQLTQLTHLHISIDPKGIGRTHELQEIGSGTFGLLSKLTQLASLSLSFSAAAQRSGLNQTSVLRSLTQLSLTDISANGPKPGQEGMVQAIGEAWSVLKLQRLQLRLFDVEQMRIALEKVQPQHLQVLDVALNDLQHLRALAVACSDRVDKLTEQLQRLTA
jgi:hypothetical protein